MKYTGRIGDEAFPLRPQENSRAVDKVLLRDAIAEVQRTPSENAPLTVEHAGILRAYLQSRKQPGFHSGAERTLCERIEKRLRQNQGRNNGAVPQVAGAENQRMQLTLRAAIDKVLQNRWSSLTPADVALLRGAYEEVNAQRTPNERIKGILSRVLAAVDARGQQFDGAAKSSDTASSDPQTWQITPVAAEDAFHEQAPKPYSVIEGMPLQIMVRTYIFDGDTIIGGDIPADVFLTVNEGRVKVAGSVSGHIVAEGDIIVEENLHGGTLFSRQGDIIVQRAMVGSTLVARSGSVTCTLLEAPKTAFAGNEFRIKEKALSATISARHVFVKEKAVSSTITSCGRVQIGEVASGSRGDTLICLQREITCERWGRTMEKEAADRHRKVRELRQQITDAEAADRFTHRLIQNCHRTALYYLLSGSDRASEALSLQGKRTREDNLRRIVAMGEGIAGYYRFAIEEAGDADKATLDKFLKEQEKSMALLKKDIESIPDEFGSGDKLYALERVSEVHGITRRLHMALGTVDAEHYLKNTFEERMKALRKTREDVSRDVERTLRGLGIPPDKLDEIEHGDDLGAMVIHLRDQAMNESNPERQQRARSPLIRLLLSSADRFARALDNRREQIAEYRSELRGVRDSLVKDRLVVFGDGQPRSCFVEAEKFDAGTVVSASSIKKSGFDTKIARVIQLERAIERHAKFTLNEDLIERID